MKPLDHKGEFLRQMEEARRNSSEAERRTAFFNKVLQVGESFEESGMPEISADRYGVSEPDTQAVLDVMLPHKFVKIRRGGELYEVQYTKSFEAGANFAACVMASAALESVLLMLAFVHKDGPRINGIIRTRHYQDGRPDVFSLSFDELIGVAIEESWISNKRSMPEWASFTTAHRSLFVRLTGTRDLPEDSSHLLLRFLQITRNHIHVSRFARSGVSALEQELELAFVIAATSYVEMRDQLLMTLARDSHLLGEGKTGK